MTAADPDAASSAPWRALTVGVLAGLAAGLFGIGGGIVIVPGLVMLAAFRQRRAHATSLAAIILIAAAGALGYALAGQIRWGPAAALGVGTVVGVLVGTRLLRTLPGPTLERGFALLLIAAAARLVVAAPTGGTSLALEGLAVVLLVGVGLAAGTLSGLMGVGGGIVMVPALSLLFGLSLVAAKGTSLAVIVPTAMAGSLENYRGGIVSRRDALLVAVGGIGAAIAASQISLGLDPQLSAWLFAGLLLVAAARLW